MEKPRVAEGVIIGESVNLGKNVVIWNYVVIGSNSQIGDGTRIGSFCDIGKDVVIGKKCVIQTQVTISNACKLGNNVFVGPNTSILNDRFPYSIYLTPSIIEDNVVIGGCVTLLPNVTVGKNSVLAAGSVVTKDVPSDTVVKGIPARITMTRQKYEEKRKAFMELRKE